MNNDTLTIVSMITKKIKLSILSFLTVLSFSPLSFSQTTVTVGTGTSTSSGTNPSNVVYRSGTTSTYRHVKTVHILTQAQLSAAGLTGISQITKWGY
jgi:hypothetical protein